MKSSRRDFIAEAEELIEEAERLLVDVQETCSTGVNPDTINALFRTIHTIKGISGLFGFKGIADFSHAFETLLDDVRLGRIDISEDLVRFLLSSMDALKKAVDDIDNDRPHEMSEYVRAIESFRSSVMDRKGASMDEDLLGRIDDSIMRVLSEYEEHRLKTNIKEGRGIYLAKAVFGLSDFDKSLNSLTGLIKSQGELISTLPTSADLPPDSIGFNLLFGSSKPVDELRQTLNIDCEELIERRGVPPVSKAAAVITPVAQEAPLRSTTTSVRVDIDKLDRILNTISELNLASGATGRIALELSDAYGHTPLVSDVFKISQTLRKRLAELQEQVLEIRMVPIGQILSRLNQAIRRHSRETGKQIEVVVYGEDTEIDKYLAEEIVDPLMHIVRNAIDHGIETPEERRGAGKREAGTIVFRAFQRGNHVVIEVKDDGAGIDLERVRKKAIEKGLLMPDANLDERQVLDLIFMPGFSTKSVVSEVSGRGVGMDVVKEKLSGLGGFVDVVTEKGKGTTFILTMPITLAILKALIARVGQERFAIPLTSMSETLVIEHRDLQGIEGRDVYNLRGEMLPIVDIARVFELERDTAERSFAVVVGYGDRRLGLLVDELIGQHEIVIKSLGDYLRGLRGFAGAAEIDRHEVVLVIDIESIIEDSISRQRAISHV